MGEGFLPLTAGGFTLGSLIADYRLEEQIGRGGMAVVFRARDERLSRPVALKVLSPALAADVEFRHRFIREPQAAAAVDDPNIIPVYEAGEADGVLFIAMRLVRGGDLKSIVATQGPLPPSRVGRIISAIASALDAAHAAGLVHRDVKPHNMLLDVRKGRPDHVYLSDFGLSKTSAASIGLTGAGQFLGTVDYCAPEQVQGHAVDGRADQYALGCSAFELLCGENVFVRDRGMAVLLAHISETPPLPTSRRQGLGPSIDSVFAKVLAKNPEDRYSTCQEFAEALRLALAMQLYTAGATGTALPAEFPALGIRHPSHPSRPVDRRRDRRTVQAGLDRSRSTTSVDAGTRPAISDNPSVRARVGRPRRRARMLMTAVVAVVVVIAAAAGLLLTRVPSAKMRQVAVIQTFPPRHYRGGLVAVRRWVLSGRDGSVLTDTIVLSNPTARVQLIVFDEPVPAAIAPSLTLVHFTPVAVRHANSGRLAQWTLRVPAYGHIVVGYQVTVPADGATKLRLERWVRDLDALAAQVSPKPPSDPVRSLSVKPRRLRLTAGTTARLTITGVLSDGKRASPASLATVKWQSGNPKEVSVSRFGKITARSAGTTLVTAGIGNVSTSALVTVTRLTAPNPSTAYTPPTPVPTSHPTPRPTTVTISPSPPSTSPTPSPSDFFNKLLLPAAEIKTQAVQVWVDRTCIDADTLKIHEQLCFGGRGNHEFLEETDAGVSLDHPDVLSVINDNLAR